MLAVWTRAAVAWAVPLFTMALTNALRQLVCIVTAEPGHRRLAHLVDTMGNLSCRRSCPALPREVKQCLAVGCQQLPLSIVATLLKVWSIILAATKALAYGS